MIIEYDSIYTEFPTELVDAPGLLETLRDNALGWAITKHAELLQGPPQLVTQPDHIYDYSALKWPALRVHFSANDAESII